MKTMKKAAIQAKSSQLKRFSQKQQFFRDSPVLKQKCVEFSCELKMPKSSICSILKDLVPLKVSMVRDYEKVTFDN